MHADPEEVRLFPRSGQTLADALADAGVGAGAHGYNAVDFQEFAFVPHARGSQPRSPALHRDDALVLSLPPARAASHRMEATARPGGPRPGLRDTESRSRGLNPLPDPVKMRHYLFLSLAHALEKYVDKVYDPDEVARGRSRRRASLTAQDIRFPGRDELRTYRGDDRLDASAPHAHHLCFPPPA